jgi:Acyltransferase
LFIEDYWVTDPFSDIRPYRDDEVAQVLSRWRSDAEFLNTLAAFRLAGIARFSPALARALVKFSLGRKLRGVNDIHGMQMIVKAYMDHMIAKSSGGLSVSGLDALDTQRPYLFISNHRDIAMDPAFTNFALNTAGLDTVRIAIGDNLLTKPWVSDLMRLNKSFIVKRSVSGPRELLAASKNLAAYIRHSLLEENSSVWIAQREGRAKNGIDKTEPVIIKMLSMSRDKRSESFGEHIARLNIVPVSISYELDPCDALKAHELHEIATHGRYEKGEQEDIASIGRGISGDKGRVHVSFGTPLGSEFENAAEVAAEIDRQIIRDYCLHPTNFYAWRMLHGAQDERADELEKLFSEGGDCTRDAFEARINAMPEAHRPYALAIYANAIASKLDAAA